MALAVLFVSLPAGAVIETYEFSEPSLERRYHVLSDELRCPKCQNQTIADSNAPIAKDLRFLLHQQLAGWSGLAVLVLCVLLLRRGNQQNAATSP